jgi:hypothetical protein
VSPADRDELRRFRAKYPGISWHRLGRLFGLSGLEAARWWVGESARSWSVALALLAVEAGASVAQAARRQAISPSGLHAYVGRLDRARAATRGAA